MTLILCFYSNRRDTPEKFRDTASLLMKRTFEEEHQQERRHNTYCYRSDFYSYQSDDSSGKYLFIKSFEYKHCFGKFTELLEKT